MLSSLWYVWQREGHVVLCGCFTVETSSCFIRRAREMLNDSCPRGLTTWKSKAYFAEQYSMNVSADFIGHFTDEILPEPQQ